MPTHPCCTCRRPQPPPHSTLPQPHHTDANHPRHSTVDDANHPRHSTVDDNHPRHSTVDDANHRRHQPPRHSTVPQQHHNGTRSTTLTSPTMSAHPLCPLTTPTRNVPYILYYDT